jgi:alginate O-acetyltransferase complex protein AlgI
LIFNTFIYFFLFLMPSAVLFRLVGPSLKPWILVLSGVAFFIYFSVTTVGGWLGAYCLSLFLWEAVTSRFYRPGSSWCWLGIAQALVILFVFKYWNFSCGLLAGPDSAWLWQGAFLPLGISFFTFEFIHYAADRRAAKTEAGSFAEYLAFILFFPTMVAGPIKRFQDFLPAIRQPSTRWSSDWERGITRILSGLVKKFVIADVMTSLTVHLNATEITTAQRWVLPIWLLAYAIQIYMDFSSYSDIAIGSARLFGLRVKENFDWPYLQSNLSLFWSHWHMSLTKWLTDYVFIPLGGSRVSSIKIYRNLLITLLISGFWHGAGLHFIVWGLWHGLALIIHRWWSHRFPNLAASTSPFLVLASWLLTMFVVCIGWAFFIMDIPTSMLFFQRLIFG